MNTITDLSRTEIIRGLLILRPRLRANGIVGLAIFGSRARGNPRPESDLDVLIDVSPSKKFSLIDLVGISHIISDESGVPANLFMSRSLDARIATTIRDETIESFNE